jgi:hypothetical protein
MFLLGRCMILGAPIANRTPGAEIDGELSATLPLQNYGRVARNRGAIGGKRACSYQLFRSGLPKERTLKGCGSRPYSELEDTG